jgi:hypothetical protein
LVKRWWVAVLWAVTCGVTSSCAYWHAEGYGVHANHVGAPATLNGIRFQARNNGVNDWGPVISQVRVTVTNTLAHDTTIVLLSGNCSAIMRIYRRPAETDKPVYDATAGAECYVPELRAKLAPNESVELVTSADGPAVQLTTGRYYLSVLVTPALPKGVDTDLPPRIELPAGEIDVRRP